MAFKRTKRRRIDNIIDVTAITPNIIEIKEPNVKYLKARLSMLFKGFNMDDERQKLSGDTIEIKTKTLII